MSGSSTSPSARQLAMFDELWRETCSTCPPTGFTNEAQVRKAWTITTTPETAVWQPVVDLLAVLASRCPWNATYAIPQFHVTIAGLGPSPDWQHYESQLRSAIDEVTAEQKPIEISLLGLNILRNTIIVQVIDMQDQLRRLVSLLTQALEMRGLAAELRIGRHSELWWTSVVRLYSPIPDEMFDFVNSSRNTDFGSTQITSIQLTETTKTFDPANTRIIYDRLFPGNKRRRAP